MRERALAGPDARAALYSSGAVKSQSQLAVSEAEWLSSTEPNPLILAWKLPPTCVGEQVAIELS